jgi:hypothetical protein
VPVGAGQVDEKWVARNGECGPEFATESKNAIYRTLPRAVDVILRIRTPDAMPLPYTGSRGLDIWSGR